MLPASLFCASFNVGSMCVGRVASPCRALVGLGMCVQALLKIIGILQPVQFNESAWLVHIGDAGGKHRAASAPLQTNEQIDRSYSFGQCCVAPSIHQCEQFRVESAALQ